MPPKKKVQDIVPAHKRTIKDVSRYPTLEHENHSRETSRERIKKEVEKEYDAEKTQRVVLRKAPQKTRSEAPIKLHEKPRRQGSRISGTLVTFVVVFVCIAIIAIALSLVYSKAVVTIVPKTLTINVNSTYTAKKGAAAPDLSYNVVTGSMTESQQVPATSGPAIQTKAKGSGYLYNTQSTSQKIIAGTRLSNTSGLIYRTTETVVIPAGKTVAGKATPGSIAIDLIADQGGSSYNMSLSDLTGDLNVVAYKGEAKYTEVYGRISTDVTGGYSGNQEIISSSTQAAAVQTIEAKLKTDLTAKLTASLSNGSILYANAVTIAYTVVPNSSAGTSTANISIDATAYGVTFDSNALLNFIADKQLAAFSGISYTTQGLGNLTFAIVNTKDFSPQKGTPLIFTLKGPVVLTGSFSQTALQNQLKGISLSQSNAIFAQYPGIGNAYALITPFWMRSFPNSTEKIILDIKPQ